MDLEKEVDAFDTDEIGGEYLADSTNYGWGFGLGAMRRDGELDKMDSNIEAKILTQLIPWLEDENHSWDLGGWNDPEDYDMQSVWWQMGKILEEHFNDFPRYLVLLLTKAVTELCPKVTPLVAERSEIREERIKARGACNSSAVAEKISQRTDELFALKVEQYSEIREEVNVMEATETFQATGMNRFVHGSPEHRAAFQMEIDHVNLRLVDLNEEIKRLSDYAEHLEQQGISYEETTADSE